MPNPQQQAPTNPAMKQVIGQMLGLIPKAGSVSAEQRQRAIDAANTAVWVNELRKFAKKNPQVLTQPVEATGGIDVLSPALSGLASKSTKLRTRPSPEAQTSYVFHNTLIPMTVDSWLRSQSGASAPEQENARFSGFFKVLGMNPELADKNMKAAITFLRMKASSGGMGLDPMTEQTVRDILAGKQRAVRAKELWEAAGISMPEEGLQGQAGAAMPAQPAGAPKGPSQPRFDPRKGLIRGTPQCHPRLAHSPLQILIH